MVEAGPASSFSQNNQLQRPSGFGLPNGFQIGISLNLSNHRQRGKS